MLVGGGACKGVGVSTRQMMAWPAIRAPNSSMPVGALTRCW